MNLNQSFRRKVFYIVAIALLLFPIYLIGQPASADSGGGTLPRLRAEYNLSQAQLGDIDPASESIKLATLGLKGIAVSMLWDRANEYKDKEEFDNLRVTVDQIIKLQPNFLTIWEFQAHQLAYNTSVEFDDYRARYEWIKKGINFLIEGTRLNRDSPQLYQETGRFMSHKLGNSDEKRLFRELFRRDDYFHAQLRKHVLVDEARGADDMPDNFLVARLWFELAEQAIQRGGKLRQRTPLILYSQKPMCLVNYAAAREAEGHFDDASQKAYADALNDWIAFGNREIPSGYGHPVVLNSRDELRRTVDEYRRQVIALAPGVREVIRKEKEAQLPEEAKMALSLPDHVRTNEQRDMVSEAKGMTYVTTEEIALRAPVDKRQKALNIFQLSLTKEIMLEHVEQSISMINFDYWKTRCEVEQTDDAILARGLVKQATELLKGTELEKARAKFEEAWVVWDRIFQKYPALQNDIMAEELIDSIVLYKRGLEQLDIDDLPKDFKLKYLLKYFDLRLPGDLPPEARRKMQAAQPKPANSK